MAVADIGRFWDGYEDRRWTASAGPLDRNNPDYTNPDYTFPLACGYDARQGRAVGLTPDSIVSTLHCGAAALGRADEIFYETRLAVDADHPQAVTFFSYPFRPTFGYLDAVQDYYRTFPEAFRPVAGDRVLCRSGGYGDVGCSFRVNRAY